MNISFDDITRLLQELIKHSSYSKEEAQTAEIIESFFKNLNISVQRKKNNVWARNLHYDVQKPNVLLNSHHDTIRPRSDWTRDPFLPSIEDGKIFGLGSNDAGGPLVCLIAVFLQLYDRSDLSYNITFLASAEEEISGRHGIEYILSDISNIDFGIVGEPTAMKMAIAEKGLLVLDCVAQGVSGHAARDIGNNAIYMALEDINWIRNFEFPKVSQLLGPVKMTVTMIRSGSQHNVIPDRCEFVVDVRSTDLCSNDEVLSVIRKNMKSTVTPRSMRLQSSKIAPDHILIKTAEELGISTFGSDTLSDQALLPFPTVKIGPGDPDRSHSADEYIWINDLKAGIKGYLQLLERIDHSLTRT